jgi:TRAP-type C4-dicarboxylate transport system permease small subunit
LRSQQRETDEHSQSTYNADIASLRDFRGGPDGECGVHCLPDGVHPLCSQREHDFVTYNLIAATFIGAPYVLLTKGHVNVDVLPIYVGERARYWLAICAITVSLGFCLLMTVLTFQFWYEAYEGRWVSDTMWRARLWIPYSAMPVGLGILTLQYVADLLNLLTGREPPFGVEVKERSVDVSLPDSGAEVNIPGAGI